MGMIGVIDPSHYERAHDKPGRLPHWLSLEEVMEAAANPTPKWSPWTYEMVNAVLSEHQERGERISTTALIAADPRTEIIKRKTDYIGDLDDMYVALRGTMVHRTLEAYPRADGIAEVRFHVVIDGIDISCTPDLLTRETLTDYKVPVDQSGIPSFGYPYRHQTEQLMLNAFITRHAERWDVTLPDGTTIENPPLPFDPREHPAKQVDIVYIGPKGPKIILYERKEDFITPKGKTKTAKRPYVWSDAEVLEFFRPRLHLFQAALDSFPRWPDPWRNPDDGTEHTFESVFGIAPQPDWLIEAYLEHTGVDPRWQCPGYPLCKLPTCLARRWPSMLTWENDDGAA